MGLERLLCLEGGLLCATKVTVLPYCRPATTGQDSAGGGRGGAHPFSACFFEDPRRRGYRETSIAAMNASTTAGSNWVPAQRLSSSIASSGRIADR